MRQQAQKQTAPAELPADIVLLTTFDPHAGTVLESSIKVEPFLIL